MPLDNPPPGPFSATEFMVSGLPWVSSSNVVGVVRYDFPQVTRDIEVRNGAGANIRIAFSLAGFTSNNYIPLSASTVFDADVRIKSLWLSCSQGSTADVTVVAALTGIQARFFPALTGSNGNQGVG